MIDWWEFIVIVIEKKKSSTKSITITKFCPDFPDLMLTCGSFSGRILLVYPTAFTSTKDTSVSPYLKKGMQNEQQISYTA